MHKYFTTQQSVNCKTRRRGCDWTEWNSYLYH